MGINTMGLRGFRRDIRRGGDPDETEGRALYRARAEAEARMSIGLARKVTYLKDQPHAD